MESQRTFLFIALLLVSYLLFTQWQEDYNPKVVVTPQSTVLDNAVDTPSSEGNSGGDIPASSADKFVQPVTEADRYVTVQTNVLSITIDTLGGDIIDGKLLNYQVEQGQEDLVSLLTKQHQAQSGLIGRDGPDGSSKGRPRYSVEQEQYTVKAGGEVEIPLTWANPQGLSVTKTFTIKPNEYDITVAYTVNNRTSAIKSVRPFGQLKKIIPEPESTMMMNAYNAATYSTDQERYEKYDLDDMAERNLNKNTKGGWVA
ncbi:MAG: YidC/Oxa1 family membrane protein insertase, partial [Alteromonadaceae bacterium]